MIDSGICLQCAPIDVGHLCPRKWEVACMHGCGLQTQVAAVHHHAMNVCS